LRRFKSAAISDRCDRLNYTSLPFQEYDWAKSVHGNAIEEMAKDTNKQLCNPVVTFHYVDANLYHDLLTGRSVTSAIHFCSQTLVDWVSKRQKCVQAATFRSEIVAARITVTQIEDIRKRSSY
jgi:hypothetical protein